ncbi:MAG: phenylacetate-CoA oxygenase subunit PaaJ [Chitinophagia bacterium]|jgi:ring-1,2-phenylacetyl-CoA epoxidase subunit PaaD|nr:phenylacetate-CoA oxygenase subunit PaaJ [Chitinophagia bacterium]
MITVDNCWAYLDEVADPEVPVLSIIDLGIVRDVFVDSAIGSVRVVITPTYSGCPAMDVIAMQIRMCLLSKGAKQVLVENQISPSWTTDWMTEKGKEKLEAYGIAPPKRKSSNPLALFEEDTVTCPKCKSNDTILTSQFGATSCKALYKCNHCKEPFEHFKCH